MSAASAPAVSAYAHTAAYSPARRRIALVVAALAFLLELLDSTIVNLAIPSIRAGLGASAGAVQWVVAGYALSFSMCLIVGGRLGDAYGYRRLFLTGVSAFALTSLGCGLAGNAVDLAIARVAQGAAAALMAPQVMSMVQLLYRPHERGAAMGVFGALGGLGASLGPVLGGLLIRADLFGLGWRPIFLINLPLAAFAFIAGLLALPPGRAPHPPRLDLRGAALMLVAAFLLTFPLIEGREVGWPGWAFAMLAVSPLVFLVYRRHILALARRGGAPLTPPALFASGAFTAGLVITLLLQVALNGYFFTFSLVLQLGLGLPVLTASLTSLPFSVGVAIGIALISRRFAADAARRLLRAGLAVLGGAWLVLPLLLPYAAAAPARLAPVLLVAGLGMGMAVGPLSSLILSRTPVTEAGAASGVLNAVQQFGAALGAALIGTLFFALAGPSGAAAYVAVFQWPLWGAVLLLAAAFVGAGRLPATPGTG